MTPYGRTFKPILVNNSIHAMVNQLIWADAIYVRDFMAFMDLPAKAQPAAARKTYPLAALALDAHDKQTGSALQLAYLRRLSGR